MISILGAMVLFLLMGLLIFDSPTAAQAALEGLLLCGRQLIPALFPFFVVSSLLPGQPGAGLLALPLTPFTRMVGIKNPQAPLLLLLSWCGGYAVCARVIGEGLEAGQLSQREARLLLVLGCTSSPGFVIGAVGTAMLGSPLLGVCFYFACLVGNLLCGIASRPFLVSEKEIFPVHHSPKAMGLTQAIQTAVRSCLTVSGCVVFFRVVTALFTDLLGLSQPQTALLGGLLEISGGCAALAGAGGVFSVYGVCGALSLLSCSVLLQMKSLLNGQCSLRCLILTRPLHLVITLTALSLMLRLFPKASPVYSSLAPRLILVTRSSPDVSVLLFLLCLVLLQRLQQKDRPGQGGQ